MFFIASTKISHKCLDYLFVKILHDKIINNISTYYNNGQQYASAFDLGTHPNEYVNWIALYVAFIKYRNNN